ncbi:glutathione S-transferase family protein [Oceanobacter mangrovi]|uniref:glutathione S-transferase family protein n=1 Tax=Oceanobacter mangrovi TaxID=2862510 RepID=UPI001C8DE44E|nr:glutathione S-transferase family protein [Oceanobacter mangrovi]
MMLFGPAFSPYIRAARLYAAELGMTLECSMAPFGERIKPGSAEHQALNPFGKFPVLLTDDFKLFETAAICRYLDSLAGDKSLLAPLTQQQRALVDQWTGAMAIYGRLYTMDGFMLELVFPKGENGQPRMDVIRDHLPQARSFIAIVEQQLSQHQWLAGEYYSMADSMLTPFLDHLTRMPVLDDQGPIITAGSACADYLQRVRARSSAWVLAET